MSSNGGSAIWVTRRTHLQVSRSEVLPVVFKSRRHPSPSDEVEPVPPAFAETEAQLSDCLPVLKEWLLSHVDRMHRSGPMNVKPGALETPDVLRHGSYMFTVWFEPTAAFFSVLHRGKEAASGPDPGAYGSIADAMYEGFFPTPQTLHVVAELSIGQLSNSG